jgi:hypothetical protein
VRFDDFLGDRQAQADAGGTVGARDTEEFFEDARCVLRGNADPGIFDGEFDLPVLMFG